MANDGNKGFASGERNSIKYSADVTYTIHIPYDLQVTSAEIRGYDNYREVDSYLSLWNDVEYSENTYRFPAKNDDEAQWKTYTIDMTAAPAQDALNFKISGKQTCLVIDLTCTRRDQQAIDPVTPNPLPVTRKILRNGQVIFVRDNKAYTILGQTIY